MRRVLFTASATLATLGAAGIDRAAAQGANGDPYRFDNSPTIGRGGSIDFGTESRNLDQILIILHDAAEYTPDYAAASREMGGLYVRARPCRR